MIVKSFLDLPVGLGTENSKMLFWSRAVEPRGPSVLVHHWWVFEERSFECDLNISNQLGWCFSQNFLYSGRDHFLFVRILFDVYVLAYFDW